MGDSLINKVESQSQSDLESWFASLGYNGDFKVNEAGDMMNLILRGEVFNKTDEGFSNYRLSYAQDNLTGNNDYRRRYTPWASNGYSYNAGVGYDINWTDKFRSIIRYNYEQKYTHEDNNLYRLDQLAGWGVDSDHKLGALPSVTDYLTTVDASNSYLSDNHVYSHKPLAIFTWQVVEDDKNDIMLKSQWNFDFSHEHMRYARASLDKVLSRNTTFLNPEFTLYWSGYGENRRCFTSLVYSINHTAPQMVYSFNYTDDVDPLNVKRYGNANLKNSTQHRVELVHNGNIKSLMYDLNYNYVSTSNAVAMGFIYDRNMGKRTFSPTNVDGNWSTNVRLGLSGNVDKKKKLSYLVGRLAPGL